jgi:hypothetical protein
MKALAIKQPYAWLIVHGIKDIENRTWNTTYRGRFYVHACKGFDQEAYDRLRREGHVYLPPKDVFQRGGLIGTVDLVDVVTESNSEWFTGPYGFILRDPQPINFKPYSGQLGMFNVETITPLHQEQRINGHPTLFQVKTEDPYHDMPLFRGKA